MNDIEKAAWDRQAPKPKEDPERQLIYCVARAAYANYTDKVMPIEAAQALKMNVLAYYEMIKSMAKGSARLIVELGKATAPRSELKGKNKDQLIEIILRIEGLAYGLMKEYGENIPGILRMEVTDD